MRFGDNSCPSYKLHRRTQHPWCSRLCVHRRSTMTEGSLRTSHSDLSTSPYQLSSFHGLGLRCRKRLLRSNQTEPCIRLITLFRLDSETGQGSQSNRRLQYIAHCSNSSMGITATVAREKQKVPCKGGSLFGLCMNVYFSCYACYSTMRLLWFLYRNIVSATSVTALAENISASTKLRGAGCSLGGWRPCF